VGVPFARRPFWRNPLVHLLQKTLYRRTRRVSTVILRVRDVLRGSLSIVLPSNPIPSDLLDTRTNADRSARIPAARKPMPDADFLETLTNGQTEAAERGTVCMTSLPPGVAIQRVPPEFVSGQSSPIVQLSRRGREARTYLSSRLDIRLDKISEHLPTRPAGGRETAPYPRLIRGTSATEPCREAVPVAAYGFTARERSPPGRAQSVAALR
jgi:hypothetical protein